MTQEKKQRQLFSEIKKIRSNLELYLVVNICNTTTEKLNFTTG